MHKDLGPGLWLCRAPFPPFITGSVGLALLPEVGRQWFIVMIALSTATYLIAIALMRKRQSSMSDTR